MVPEVEQMWLGLNVDAPSAVVQQRVHHSQEALDELSSLPFRALHHVLQVLVEDKGERGLSEVFPQSPSAFWHWTLYHSTWGFNITAMT